MSRPQSIAVPAAAAEHSDPQRDVRVMLVDDSLVVRSILERIIESRDGLTICASMASAQEALDFLAREHVDVIVLDLEMPGMNGIDALPHLLARSQFARVLILSSNCEEGGSAAIKALSLGACDTLAKPGKGSFSGRFSDILVERILTLGRKDRPIALTIPPPLTARAAQTRRAEDISWSGRVECIGVAASTGGIPSFANFIAHLDPAVSAPILLTQHLPDAFVAYYARQIATLTTRTVLVGEAGMPLRPNHVYLAPGDHHLMVVGGGRKSSLALDDRPMANGCCPSADPMLGSIADVFRAHAVAVILSGMGRDGADGARRLKQAGGAVFAQAPETCVVWGMPGAVSKAGIATATLNPDAIALKISGLALADRR